MVFCVKARINRDSQLLARLNNSTELELEDDLLESTFQTTVNDESAKHTSQDQDDLSDLLIEIEFPIGSINVLNSYFGMEILSFLWYICAYR